MAPVPALFTSRAGSRHLVTGRLLTLAAAIAFLVPWPHQVLTSVGTDGGQTLESAGFERRLTIPTADVPTLQGGDSIVSSLIASQQAAAHNELAADRRLLCLALGLPGMYLLGRSRREHPGER